MNELAPAVRNLLEHFAVLQPTLAVQTVKVSPELYASLDRNFDQFRGHVLMTDIELHDQGGAADIASPSERVFPLFRIHEKGNHVPIAYAYAADNADRFGLNLGWFYILCREKDQGAPEA